MPCEMHLYALRFWFFFHTKTLLTLRHNTTERSPHSLTIFKALVKRPSASEAVEWVAAAEDATRANKHTNLNMFIFSVGLIIHKYPLVCNTFCLLLFFFGGYSFLIGKNNPLAKETIYWSVGQKATGKLWLEDVSWSSFIPDLKLEVIRIVHKQLNCAEANG